MFPLERTGSGHIAPKMVSRVFGASLQVPCLEDPRIHTEQGQRPSRIALLQGIVKAMYDPGDSGGVGSRTLLGVEATAHDRC